MGLGDFSIFFWGILDGNQETWVMWPDDPKLDGSNRRPRLTRDDDGHQKKARSGL